MRSFIFKALTATIFAAFLILIAIVIKAVRGSRSSCDHGSGDVDLVVLSDDYSGSDGIIDFGGNDSDLRGNSGGGDDRST
ncbi:hypothetical protein GJ688_00025 [Heliobacillus mobilis]|uniref:Uncharacterized protein n=1 Tax=Heliobacterium mobile TaxID=28064 RepID=A0A6I3SFV9_HELMO|nr:hypothetical protein [Heliobacterium mobile]MTV47364.1 hypothetical protein [Heliobacterium mobile]